MGGTTDMKRYSLLVLCAAVLCLGCSTGREENSSAGKAVVLQSRQEVETLTLQYRISMDAVAPSKFVAVYEDGMTLGLKIRWELDAAEGVVYAAVLAFLRGHGIGGVEL